MLLFLDNELYNDDAVHVDDDDGLVHIDDDDDGGDDIDDEAVLVGTNNRGGPVESQKV